MSSFVEQKYFKNEEELIDFIKVFEPEDVVQSDIINNATGEVWLEAGQKVEDSQCFKAALVDAFMDASKISHEQAISHYRRSRKCGMVFRGYNDHKNNKWVVSDDIKFFRYLSIEFKDRYFIDKCPMVLISK